MKNWYNREGYVQFLLGNQWNCTELRAEGRVLLIASWTIQPITMAITLSLMVGIIT